MKKKFLWLMLSFLLVAALVLASCGEAVPGEEEEEEEEEEEPVGQQEEEEEEPVGEQEEEEEEEPVAGVPVYGGVPTIVNRTGPHAGIPDPHAGGNYPSWYFYHPVLERIIVGDIEKYGLGRGGSNEGEWDFAQIAWPPFKYQSGRLVESWEVTADKIVLNIRPGVYFSGISPNPVMESREYTADDNVFNLRRMLEMGIGASLAAMDLIKTPYEEHIYAEGRYTVVIETTRFDPEWWFNLIYQSAQIAPESVEAGPREWENMVGTGAFTIKEFVPGSHIEYGRNPNYWRKTTINGIEYQLPFLDGFIKPILDDEATTIAALRTGTFDAYLYADWVYVDSLTATTPDLLRAEAPLDPIGVLGLDWRVDIPPFSDRQVRRALFIGTDRASIAQMALGRVEKESVYQWPIGAGVEGHVPLDQLPPETRLLFDYNPDLARQMLADAGYPDGFKAQLIVPRRPLIPEAMEMLAGLWLDEFGIELELKVVDLPLLGPLREELKHNADIGWRSISPALTALRGSFYTDYPGNDIRYSNPYFDERLDEAARTVDTAERVTILEELFLLTLDDALGLPFSQPIKYTYWWPWIKNYYGEKQYWIHDPPYDMMWFDQALKAEMGF